MPEIEAKIENVSTTNRSTSLAKGEVHIHTVEHVLATLAGYGIDNAVIDLDGTEPPIDDGSARGYCEKIEEAGVVVQSEKREPFEIIEPIQLQLDGTFLAVFPDDSLRISCTSSDKQGHYTQYCSLEVTPENWEKEMSHARTFCFYEEIEYLIRNGLIQGGSLENAVVIRDDVVLTTEPLRYHDEFVRHKMLDLLGDLSLLGRPLVGHLIAIRPSHSANCEFVRQLNAQLRESITAAQTFAPPPMNPKETNQEKGTRRTTDSEEHEAMGEPLEVKEDSGLDVDQVMRLLPHRYPFLMVDRVTQIEGNRLSAVKNVSINEPFFQGHFPGHPIMPGVLQLEAIAQVAGILMLKQAENTGKLAYFMSAENVKWRKPVRPGDVLVINVQLTKFRSKIGKAKGTCLVGDQVVSEADVTFMLMDPNEVE